MTNLVMSYDLQNLSFAPYSAVPVIIFDIDGTLSNPKHRLHFIQGAKKDWPAFYSAAADDPVNVPMLFIYSALKQSCHPVFVTGRPESIRKATEAWLRKNFVTDDAPIDLFMRKGGDYRPDFMLKQDILKALRKAGYAPLAAIEDRQQVVAMYRREGLLCLQCADGNY